MKEDSELPPRFRSDAIKHEVLMKQQKLEKLKKELVKVSEDNTDKIGLKKAKNIKLKLDYLRNKFEEVLNFQETLRFMLGRDLKNLNK